MSVDSLAPKIRQILTSPDTDLTTVSAKRVRKQLVELEPGITLDFIKQNKDAIDTLIGSIFEGLNNPDAGVGARAEPRHTQAAASSNVNGKRKRGGGREEVHRGEGDESQGENEQASGDDDATSHSAEAPASKRVKKGSTQALTDEEYARQLSSEINQRPSRGGGRKVNVTKKAVSRSPKKKKSRAEIEDSDEDDEDARGSAKKSKTAKPRKKTTGGGEAKGGSAKMFTLSEPLAAVVNAPSLSRFQVVKKLWEYIKGNDLQNPKNKKEILCDDHLRAVFNADKVGMFAMNKIIGQHLYEPES